MGLPQCSKGLNSPSHSRFARLPSRIVWFQDGSGNRSELYGIALTVLPRRGVDRLCGNLEMPSTGGILGRQDGSGWIKDLLWFSWLTGLAMRHPAT
jgi:hypothetical protein